MNVVNIIWDFDGTILPNTPYDSEQSLIQHKLNMNGESISIFVRTLARILNYADNKEFLSRSFKHFYGWFMRGTHVSVLNAVCEQLAENIFETDRQALLDLNSRGHRMAVLSCGTADLSERVLKIAGVYDCFEFIAGNRFQIENNRITGMILNMNQPESKVNLLQKMGIPAKTSIAVGDGYTDVPMLDWSRFPIVIDRSGQKRKRFAEKDYDFISSISELLPLIEKKMSFI